MTEPKKRKGRRPVKIDDELFEREYYRYITRDINKYEMAQNLNVSRPTLDKILKEKGLL